MFHQRSRCDFAQIWKLWALSHTRNSYISINHLQQDWHLIGKIDHAVRMFHHCDTLLLPQVRGNAQHRDRTWRGNSSFRSLRMFRIRSCILLLGMHSSSGSRTRDTTCVLRLNHGWNRTFVMLFHPTWTALFLTTNKQAQTSCCCCSKTTTLLAS